MRLAYIGNFGPSWSTENHVRVAFERRGHDVFPAQENDPWAFPKLAGVLEAAADDALPDFVLWTRTGWNPPVDHGDQLALIEIAEGRGVPVVGLHLDRWWGLDREGQIGEEPFFRSSIVVTADGGHDAEWAAAGVKHVWLPPAVLGAEAELVGRKSARLGRKVVWVGSWEHYHHEWPRVAFVAWLADRYGARLEVWPKRGGGQIRGRRLNDLYCSAPVVVGDSCLAPNADGRPMTRYWSDRVPETIGRGGYLVHPWVAGLDEHYTLGEHLRTFDPGDWEQCGALVDEALEDDGPGRAIAAAGRAHVLEHHTYERRAEQIVGLVGGWRA